MSIGACVGWAQAGSNLALALLCLCVGEGSRPIKSDLNLTGLFIGTTCGGQVLKL